MKAVRELGSERVRQFGPYPVQALEYCEDSSLVREDRGECTAGVPVIVPTVNAG